MRRIKIKHLLIAAVALASTISANAQPIFTFDTDAQGFSGGAWSGSHQAVQQTSAAGGWTLGSSLMHEFDFTSGQQTVMQALANAGNGHISFDLQVDGSSFTPAVGGWYQLHYAGNSDGSAGWSQDAGGGNPVDTNHTADDNGLYTYHFDHTFSQMGWQAGDSWFQVFFGSNSDGANPVKFYVDNVNVYAVPEPSTIALGGISAALLIFRRRK